MPTLYAIGFATADDHIKYSFLWDTDSIPFMIDNYITEIINRQRRLFTGSLIPTLVTLETKRRDNHYNQTRWYYEKLLTDDATKHHLYIIPRFIFDPNTPVNILGVPALGMFFGDNADATDPIAEIGTTIIYGSTKSQFIWYHGSHERHFMHCSSRMPELYLYADHRYYKYFYNRVHKFLSNKVHFAFFSAYSIEPQTSIVINPDGPHVIPYGEGDLYDNDPHHQWYRPEIENPQNNLAIQTRILQQK